MDGENRSHHSVVHSTFHFTDANKYHSVSYDPLGNLQSSTQENKTQCRLCRNPLVSESESAGEIAAQEDMSHPVCVNFRPEISEAL